MGVIFLVEDIGPLALVGTVLILVLPLAHLPPTVMGADAANGRALKTTPRVHPSWLLSVHSQRGRRAAPAPAFAGHSLRATAEALGQPGRD